MSNKVKNICRICGHDAFSSTKYPDAHFNNKVFSYLSCKKCDSYNVFPTPNDDDFSKMYGEEDHYYLKNTEGKLRYNFNYPFADHQGYQIKFLNEIKDQLKGKTLLDYACGSGFYMKYAEQLGVKAIGIEFDKSFVSLLKEKTDLEIYPQEEFQTTLKGKTFDFIHLGHVLEHLPDPYSLIETLKSFAHKNTIFLIDGPLDRNACLHRLYVDLGSKLKGKKNREAAPQHITLTTHKSQLLFFKRLGLKKERYKIEEVYFPLPSKLSSSPGKIVSFFIATCSIFLSKLIPNFGNVFHYRGKID